MNNQERQAHEQKQEARRKLHERRQQIMREEPDPNYPLNKLSIEEQIALGIPLDTGWIATMPLPGRSSDRTKKKRSP